ncbi:metal-dependent hydrolase [Paenibacillus nanensis]|uniref:Metal-dependent hydrolase n=1 Tax=Paenibacillus nanensis TaxID=393251 RepID=A0A3A1V1C0_9BACL|nr:metal-dependent hydrolase [Paenibacillus nanensis]RIX53202.1 metal-dependent hydrolase [Paenibacillus nanensis]
MRGKTHLAIGAAVGAGAAVYFSPDLSNSLTYIGAAAFSALAADLDGTSMLSGKLTKLSRQLRQLALWGGLVCAAAVLILYVTGSTVSPILAGGSVAAALIGLTMSNGAIRNALVSMVGAFIIWLGLSRGEWWLAGLGAFVAWAPWLNHRGMTHTVWMIPLWWWLASGAEQELRLEGLAVTAAAGYLSHLVADTLTPSGVKWLYPLTKRTFKIKI